MALRTPGPEMSTKHLSAAPQSPFGLLCRKQKHFLHLYSYFQELTQPALRTCQQDSSDMQIPPIVCNQGKKPRTL